MKELYNEVRDLTEKDKKIRNATLAENLGKLLEEAGELAKEANRLTGRKKKGRYTDEEIKNNLASEAADTIQCVFAICVFAGVEYDQIKKCLAANNKGYEKYVNDGN